VQRDGGGRIEGAGEGEGQGAGEGEGEGEGAGEGGGGGRIDDLEGGGGGGDQVDEQVALLEREALLLRDKFEVCESVERV